ncbi:hypothetical protein AB0B31_25660 [Catellatospora citrea]|uniref:hypothetical protein n=1 Tax=Catellatospora citrea TaxID=53366 RepID=UPI0033F62632
MIATVLSAAMMFSQVAASPARADPITECHRLFPGDDSYNKQHEWQCVLNACPWLNPNNPYAGDGWYYCQHPDGDLRPSAVQAPDPVGPTGEGWTFTNPRTGDTWYGNPEWACSNSPPPPRWVCFGTDD